LRANEQKKVIKRKTLPHQLRKEKEKKKCIKEKTVSDFAETL